MANKKGIIITSGNGLFLPGQSVARDYTKAVMSCPLSITRDAINYDDSAGIDSVYKKAVTSIQQAGVIMGEKNNTKLTNEMMAASIFTIRMEKHLPIGWIQMVRNITSMPMVSLQQALELTDMM